MSLRKGFNVVSQIQNISRQIKQSKFSTVGETKVRDSGGREGGGNEAKERA